MLVVYRTIRSLCGGCMYKRVDVMAVRVWCLLLHVSALYGCHPLGALRVGKAVLLKWSAVCSSFNTCANV